MKFDNIQCGSCKEKLIEEVREYEALVDAVAKAELQVTRAEWLYWPRRYPRTGKLQIGKRAITSQLISQPIFFPRAGLIRGLALKVVSIEKPK